MSRIVAKILACSLLLYHSPITHAQRHGGDERCADSPERFVLYGNGDEIQIIMKTCWDVRRDPSLCDEHTALSIGCPVACGTCGGGTVQTPDNCVLDLDLKFPWRRPDVVRFYSSDTVLVKKKGAADGHESEAVCSSSNDETEWGCTHEGVAFVQFDRAIVGNYQASERDEENLRISNAAGNSYRVQVRHKFSDKEVGQEPNSKRSAIRSRLLFKVNGRRKKVFKTAKNLGIPTHIVEEDFPMLHDTMPGMDELPSDMGSSLPGEPRQFPPDEIPLPGHDDDGVVQEYDPDLSGYINPEYRGSYFVNIDCDNDCNCRFKRQKAKCEVTAKLLPNAFNFNRKEKLTVRKEGTNGSSCSKDYPESWDCSHFGDAKVSEVMITDYIIVSKQAEAVKVVDASSSTHSFTVEREETENDDGNPFELYIFTPKKRYGPLSVVENGTTFSVKSWGLSCDQFCNCDEPFELPTIQ